jgi:GNAT superfamily N-acetyltransferase
MPEIRLAKVEEAERLTDLALRSKAHWGYSQDFMDACRHELVISPAAIKADEVFVLEEEDDIQGFYSLAYLKDGTAEIMHLFVEPGAIGKGYGAMLWQHAKEAAIRTGYKHLLVESDPNARAFYEKWA